MVFYEYLTVSPKALAMPKSMNLRLPSFESIRFSGLRSRCIMKLLWRYCRPEKSWYAKFFMCCVFNFADFSAFYNNAARLPFAKYSITMHGLASASWKTSMSSTMQGCRCVPEPSSYRMLISRRRAMEYPSSLSLKLFGFWRFKATYFLESSYSWCVSIAR